VGSSSASIFNDTVNPSPTNRLQVNVVQVPPGATTTVTGNGTNNVQVQICWTPTFANVGQNYNVVVSVSNNTCPIRGRWDYTYALRVRAGIQKDNYIAVVRGPGDTVVTRDTLVCRGTRLRLYLTARDSVPSSDIASVTWTATGGATPPPSFPPNPPLPGNVAHYHGNPISIVHCDDHVSGGMYGS